MSVEAALRNEELLLKVTAAAAGNPGDVLQAPGGLAGVVTGQNAYASGDEVTLDCTPGRIFEVDKTASMVMLVGSRVFWDVSADAAHLLQASNTADFFLGTVVETATSSATKVKVALNEEPRYTVSLAQGYVSAQVSTAGWPQITGAGNGVNMAFDLTAEAQKLDALSIRGLPVGTACIVHALICVNTNGDASATDLNVGLANATHASDADSITESLFAHIDGASANINIESDDGTTEVAATDSTVDFTAGTPFLVQFDLADDTDIQVYINGVNVLSGSTFKLDAATGPLKLLAHFEKSANDSPGNVTVMDLGATVS